MREGTQRVVLREVQPGVRRVGIACEWHAEQNVFAAMMLLHPLFLHPSEKTYASLAGEYEARSKVVSDYFLNLASSARLRLSRATVLLSCRSRCPTRSFFASLSVRGARPIRRGPRPDQIMPNKGSMVAPHVGVRLLPYNSEHSIILVQ